MAAATAIDSTPVIRKQPEDIPLPPSPVNSDAVQPVKKNRKGKAKKKENKKETQNSNSVEKAVDLKQVDAEDVKAWRWTSLADFSTSGNARPPIFSKDGSYFFTIVSSSVKIHSVSTGQVISTLSVPQRQDQCADDITSAIINPQNAFQLITGSLDGYIRLWDFLEGILLQTINITQPIFHICAHEKIKDNVFVAAARPWRKDESCAVLRISLKVKNPASEAGAHQSSQVVAVGKTRFTNGLAVSANGTYLVAVAGHKAYVALTSALKSGFTKYVSPEHLTCLAVHPSEDYFATGDDKGVVRLWYCLNQNVPKVIGVEKKAQTSTLHWHAHAISSVTFTPNGAYLLSGGEEAVLVIWQLHSGRKEFVPRVGSPIKHIAVSRAGGGEEYLLGLADTSFAFVSAASLKLSRVFSKIKIDPTVSSSGPSTSKSTPLAVHAPSSTLILPSSHPSSIQAYSPSSSTLLAELEVSPSNRVARRDEKILEPSRVERAVVSLSGDWMATIDRREGDETFRGEIYLKFWWWNRNADFWILNTRIDRPHGLKNVTSATFSNVAGDTQSLQLATTGEDGNIKTWRIRTTKDKNGSVEETWTARSSFTFRSEQPKHVTWSPDDSLLVVSLGPYVVVYESHTNILRHVFITPECEVVFSAHFIGATGRYLAVVGSIDLVLWDVITQTVQWHYRSPRMIKHLVSHSYHDTFTLIGPSGSDSESGTEATVFRTSSNVPERKQKLPFGLLNVIWYSFALPSPTSPSFSLVGITTSLGVVLIGEDIDKSDGKGSSATALNKGSAAVQKRSLFQEMFGITEFSEKSKPLPSEQVSTKVDTSLPWKGSDTSSIFDGPAYLLPPMHTLFEPLIDGFLKLRVDNEAENEQNEKHEQENGDVDMNMEAVSDDEPESYNPRVDKVTDEEELDTYVSLFKEIAGSSDYPYQSSKPQQQNKTPNTSTPRPAKSPARTPGPPKTPNPESSTPKQASTPSLPAKAGKKRSRLSLG
ncbi:hypothetical protein SERLA73DRAFT_116271 [Serpula lacrymans var. lacrymans S7.3]|uniref:WD repeat-containing protein 75 second beta-propeller domain-containing protein n=1 Tax=Serpula lacrymans var. lacrymans (strain S7.3) TaxID=936435 RepID=F8QEX5_SERL3|nr:hypothetical protein SERLA73DRAFT_116271 [Serpula lacrymans var. lacrymans S7.3]